MHTAMPVGVSDFRKLRQGGYAFVDKTQMICDLLERGAMVTLFTRPRRFGKTLALSMLRYFFDCGQRSYVEELFAGTQVAATEAMREAGTRPVVFVTFKDVKRTTFSSMVEKMRSLLQDVFDAFPFLRTSERLSPQQRARYAKVADGRATADDLQDALELLTALLHAHAARPAVVLIDEYDAPVQMAQECGYYDEAIAFFRNVLSGALKDNVHLDFAVLTGVLRIAKESIFSGLNNLHVSSILSGGFAESFGFTPQEVRALAERLGHPEVVQELAEWYDGYAFQGRDIYNPWSVLKYFDEGCKAAPYWVRTSGNGILGQLLAQADETRWGELRDLMHGASVLSEVREHVVYRDIGMRRNDLYTVLLFAGYLTVKEEIDQGDRRMIYELAIPNLEVRNLYVDEILTCISPESGTVTLFQMLCAIQQGDAELFERHLGTILRQSVSMYDASHPESFYHGLMLGFSLYFEKQYRVQSNGESGYGRFDLVLEPRQKHHPGIVMEFKSVGAEKDMDRETQGALQQIREKAYATVLEERGVSPVWRYGIAFCGKRVRVAMGGAS